MLCGPAGSATGNRAADAAHTDLGIAVATHQVTNPFCEPLYGVHGNGAVLVRPEGQVAWRHPDTTDPTTAAPALTRALATASRSTKIPTVDVAGMQGGRSCRTVAG